MDSPTFAKLLSMVNSGDLDEAELLAVSWLEDDDPNAYQAYWILARIDEARGKIPSAIERIKKSVALYPDHLWNRHHAIEFLEAYSPIDALKQAEQLFALASKKDDAAFAKSALFAKVCIKKFELHEEFASEIALLEPSYADSYRGKWISVDQLLSPIGFDDIGYGGGSP